MNITRRNFVRSCGTALAAAGFLSRTPALFGQAAISEDLFTIPPASTSDPLNYLSGAHFEPFINSVFRGTINEPRRVVNFTLTAVRNISLPANTRRGYEGESYSLMLAARSAVTAGVYSFDHPILGKFSLFVGPVNQRTGVSEAIVNRIARSGPRS